MPIDNARLAPMQPGVSVEELKAALGANWKEPDIRSEGHLHIEEFGVAQIDLREMKLEWAC